MAGPQLEDGYTRFAHELLEAIIFNDFSKRELKVLLAIGRKTYGWNKKWDRISLDQFAELTNLKKNHVSTTLAALVKKKAVIRHPGRKVSYYSINKDYKLWVDNVFTPNDDPNDLPPELENDEPFPEPEPDHPQSEAIEGPKTGLKTVPKQDPIQSQNRTRGSPKVGLICG